MIITFTQNNTDGFTDDQLEAMNAELTARVIAGDYQEDNDIQKHIAEEILGEF